MGKIEIRDLTKKYGETVALDNVDLDIEENKIYGLLGRNGAGKTTLLKVLTAKLFPTAGQVTVDGESVWENERALGRMFYMAEDNLYNGSMRVKDIFRWTGEFYQGFNQEYALKLARRFDLNIQKKFKELSTGYASILKATVTLASGAEILLFDEPVLGLDANHRDLLYKEILRNYIENPKMVLISTHLIDEVADILEEAIIIEKGRIILKQPVEELLASAHTVTGEMLAVDRYVEGKRWIGGDVLHNFKSVIVLDEQPDQELARTLHLELGKPELQKLFIALTNAGRERLENE